MSSRMRHGLTVLRLLTLCEFTLSAMVLPRPPSSPNEISFERIRDSGGKHGGEKTVYSLVQLNTNVEKPNTDGYRLLEIELGGAGEMVDEAKLKGLVRAMLSGEDSEEPRRKYAEVKNNRDTFPHPEVIPNSIFGVRDMGLSPNYRIDPMVRDRDQKRRLSRPSKSRSPDEKLYYLKNGRPKVDVNVRGNSGSFTGDAITSKTSSDRISILYPPGNDRNTKSHLDKKIHGAKKYGRADIRENADYDENVDEIATSERIYGTSEYEPRPDRAGDESTTENMPVTSSELPKQIPAPPSRIPNRSFVAQTTPVQKYFLRRSDVLPGYGYGEA